MKAARGETMTKNVLTALVFAFIGLLGGTALAKNGNGLPCTFDSDCASRNCAFKACRARLGSGGKQLANGAACTFDSDCASKNCAFKVCKAR
jgi:hypothetical protein